MGQDARTLGPGNGGEGFLFVAGGARRVEFGDRNRSGTVLWWWWLPGDCGFATLFQVAPRLVSSENVEQNVSQTVNVRRLRGSVFPAVSSSLLSLLGIVVCGVVAIGIAIGIGIHTRIDYQGSGLVATLFRGPPQELLVSNGHRALVVAVVAALVLLLLLLLLLYTAAIISIDETQIKVVPLNLPGANGNQVCRIDVVVGKHQGKRFVVVVVVVVVVAVVPVVRDQGVQVR
mmetsp:Transcript_24116/g.49682  ORF Transcript_24116/g.49682 Transcript_24116/m.49682 type:complete len:231 (+) Transcript_24116:370-1062(+)